MNEVSVIYGVAIPEDEFAKILNDLSILNISPENMDCFDDYTMYRHIDVNGDEEPIYRELFKKWSQVCNEDSYIKNTPYELVKVDYPHQGTLVYYVALYNEQLENNTAEFNINCADIIKFNEWAKNMIPHLGKPKFYIHAG